MDFQRSSGWMVYLADIKKPTEVGYVQIIYEVAIWNLSRFATTFFLR